MTSDNNIFPQKFTLNNGVEMPSIGLGTFRIRNNDLILRTVDYALEAGYRMFDTAAVYGNESFLQHAFTTLLPKYDLTREDIFITTKLSPMDSGTPESVINAYNKSLELLGLDYVDLYLVHFPGAGKIPVHDPRNVTMRHATWVGMNQLYDQGLVKAIGVCNFTIRHLKDIMSSNNHVIPAVNQVEWHPYYHQPDLQTFCKEHGIVLQAYCSLGGKSSHNPELIEEPLVQNIAKKYHVTCAQVLLVWALQQNVAILPKSTNPIHLKENIRLNFKLTEEEIGALNSLGARQIKYAWDPNPVV